MTTYGQQLKQLREVAGIEAAAIAERMGWAKSQMSKRETGAVVMTEPDFLRAKAVLLELVSERDAAFAEARKAVAS